MDTDVSPEACNIKFNMEEKGIVTKALSSQRTNFVTSSLRFKQEYAKCSNTAGRLYRRHHTNDKNDAQLHHMKSPRSLYRLPLALSDELATTVCIVQAYSNATDYHRKFAITKVGDGSCPLTLCEAAYAADQAIVVDYCLHKARSNKSLELLFAYLNGFRESIPELAAFGARQVYSKQFHEFAGSFTGRQSLNFFDLESLDKAWKKEAKKRSLDLTSDEISLERRKDIFVAVVDAIIKKWKWTDEEMRNSPSVQGVTQQRQQEVVPRINPTEEELSDVIVI